MFVPWLIAPATTVRVYVLVVLLASCLSFTLYGWDKWQAMRHCSRVSERTLHTLAFAGGWPGAWLGQRIFRHKTRKPAFRLIFWLIGMLHLGLLLLVLQSTVWR